jgi:hypothetical protein
VELQPIPQILKSSQTSLSLVRVLDIALTNPRLKTVEPFALSLNGHRPFLVRLAAKSAVECVQGLTGPIELQQPRDGREGPSLLTLGEDLVVKPRAVKPLNSRWPISLRP